MTPRQTSPDPAAIATQLDELFRKLMELLREQARIRREYEIEHEKLKSTFDGRNLRFEAQIQEVKQQLLTLVKRHKKLLLSGKLKSFATEFATFSLRKASSKLKITDKSGALTAARKLGIMRKICTVKVSYTVNADKLQQYLLTHPEHRKHFLSFIEEPPEGDTLSTKPNETYHTRHDAGRISNPSIPLGPVSP